MKKKFIVYLIFLAFTALRCGSGHKEETAPTEDFEVALYFEYPDIPQPLWENARDKTIELLLARLDVVDAKYEADTTKEGLNLNVTTSLSKNGLEFLLTTQGRIELWKAIPGMQVVEELHSAEDRLSVIMYPDVKDQFIGLEYYPDSTFINADSLNLELLDSTMDVTTGLDQIKRSSLLLMAFPFTSRIRVYSSGLRAKVGEVRSRDVRDIEILFDKSFEFGLIDRSVAFYWGETPKSTDDYRELYAVDTSRSSNKILTNSQLEKVALVDDETAIVLEIHLNEAGKLGFMEYSDTHIDEAMAVLLDNLVIADPILSKSISAGKFGFRTNLDKKKAKHVDVVINNGPYPARVTSLKLKEL